MSDKGKVLIISPENRIPEGMESILRDLHVEGVVCPPPDGDLDEKMLSEVDAAILAVDKLGTLEQETFRRWAEQFHRLSLQILVLAGDATDNTIMVADGPLCAGLHESPEMLKGRLATLIGMRPHLQMLYFEREQLKMLSGPLGSHFNQVDEEMRLAARLQRDFLPRSLPVITGFKFATIFRPATWVSGDIYDVMRLDEHHVGFYIADVVGHGMPAALLTIFLKRALVTKRIEGNSYNIVDPSESLRLLNKDLVTQELSNFQFATCCYGILNTQTLKLRMANAGHPAPMRINRLAQETELPISGPLLGVFPDPEYITGEFQLHAGDKLILYSDGVEVAFVSGGPDEPLRFRKECGDLAHCDIKTMCEKLVEIIDCEEGSLNPRDDVTILGIEIESAK